MKLVRRYVDVVMAAATVAAAALASVALLEEREGRAGVVVPEVPVSYSPSLLDAWPFLMLLVLALGLSGLVLAIGARQPDVGLGWPDAIRAPGLAAREREARSTARRDRLGTKRAATAKHKSPNVWDVIAAGSAVTVVGIAMLAFVRVLGL